MHPPRHPVQVLGSAAPAAESVRPDGFRSKAINSFTTRTPIFNAPRIVIWTCAALVAIHVARLLMPTDMDISVMQRGALIPEYLDAGLGFWWTLLTYSFLHHDIPHVLINSAMILAIGSAVTRLTSSTMFVVLFLLSGLGGGVAAYLHFMQDAESAIAAISNGDIVVVVGASGSLMGLISAAAVLFYRYRDTDPRAKMMGAMVAIVTVINVLQALVGGTGIAWQAHLGGLIAGAFYGYAVLGRPPKRPGPRPVD